MNSRIYCLIFFNLMCTLVLAQNKTLSGKMLFLSSGKKPAVGVEISGSIRQVEKANTVYTKTDGSFILQFPIARVGYKVDLEVGNMDQMGTQLEIVNQKELEVCQLPVSANEEFEIIVCREGARDLAAQRYYKIIKTSSDLALKRAKNEVRKLLQQQSDNYQKIAQLSQKVAELQKQSDSIRIYQEAFRIASINKDYASLRVQRYIELLDEGQSIEMARKVLSIEKASMNITAGIRQFESGIEELEIRANASARVFDYKDALTCYDSILHFLTRLDVNKLNIAKYLSAAANVHYENASYQVAIETEKKAIAIWQQANATRLTELANSYMTIANAHFKLMELDSTLAYQKKAFAIQESLLEPSDLKLASYMNLLAITEASLGRMGQSINYQIRSTKVLEQRDTNNLETGIAYGYLALFYIMDIEDSLANIYVNKAIRIYNRYAKSPSHPLAGLAEKIADYYLIQFNMEKAIEFSMEAIEVFEQVYAPNNPTLITHYVKVANAYFLDGNRSKSSSYMVKALEVASRIWDESSLDLGLLYSKTAATYYYSNEFLKAFEFSQKGISIIERILPKESIYREQAFKLHLALKFLSVTKAKIDDYSEALDQLLWIEDQVNGEGLDRDFFENQLDIYDEFNEVQLQYFLGECYYNLKDYSSALKAYQKQKELAFSGFGDFAYVKPDSTLIIEWNAGEIGMCYLKMGQTEAFEAFMQKYERIVGDSALRQYLLIIHFAEEQNVKQVLMHLRRANALSEHDLKSLETDNLFEEIKQLPEFKQIIQELRAAVK